ncbi:MAG TPA: molybdenum cofactor guanylyltransferase [Anaerolineae bacterium]
MLSIVILAGGRSARMGQDKAWLPIEGQPLVMHVIRRVLPLAGEFILSTNRPEPFAHLAAEIPVPLRFAADLHPGAGPLAGIEAGLSAASNDLALVLAIDMPFVSLALLRFMIGQAPDYDVVIPASPDPGASTSRYEPLHALYRRTCLPAVSARLAAGDRQVISFLSDVKVRTLSPAETAIHDPAGLSYFNVNTPADWDAAQQMLKRAGD